MKKLFLIILFFSIAEILTATPRDFKRSQMHVSTNPSLGELYVRLFYRGDASPDDYFERIYLSLTYNDGITSNAFLNLIINENPDRPYSYYSSSSGIRYRHSVYKNSWYDEGDVSNHPGDRDNINSSYDSYYFVDYTFYIPAEAFNHDMSLNLNGYWTENGAVSGRQLVNENYPISQSGFGKPRNFTIDDNYCDKVILNWDPTNSILLNQGSTTTLSGTNYQTSKAGNWIYDIYRDNNLILENTSATTYTDYNYERGEQHSYVVVQKVEYLPRHYLVNNVIAETYRHIRSIGGTLGKNATNPITAKTFETADDPSNVIYDRSNCNGQLEVKWAYSGSQNPENFEIYRFLPNVLSSANAVFKVSGSDRSYRDNSVSSGQEFVYKVKARNTCPDKTSSAREYPTAYYESDYAFSESAAGALVITNGTPSAVTLTSAVSNLGNVDLAWSDADNLEDEYIVTRSGNGSTEEYRVPTGTTVYQDQNAQQCENYTYSIKAANSCNNNGVNGTNSIATYLAGNLTQTFVGAANGVQSSDGEFGDRVELKWKATNRQSENWYINRIDPSIPDTTLIAVVDGKNRFYTDRTANANTIYQYEIYGDADCAGNIISSDTTIDHGFRLAFGTVNGQITYQGGTAVEGAKVVANAASGLSGQSGLFNGSTSYIDAGNPTDLQGDSMTFMAWIKPTGLNSTTNQVVVSKRPLPNGTNHNREGWNLRLSTTGIAMDYGDGSLAKNGINIPNNTWMVVGFTITSDSVFLYMNGDLIAKEVYDAASNTLNKGGNFFIGIDDTLGRGFTGNIDEVKYYNRPLSHKEFKQSTDVFVNPSQEGLKGYWRFDEGFGDVVYDYSKTLQTANRNNGQMVDVTFDNIIPSASLLTAGAYTDSIGSYFIPFIPYLGVGDNFTITPSFQTHTFTPVNTALYIGGTSPNFTGKDFLDNSSFQFTGIVKYKGTSCFVPEIFVKIDGDVVIQNGEAVTTDVNGQFDIQVPIGRHVVSLERNGHNFEVGRFPAAAGTTFNFQSAQQGLEFIDSTLITIVGRVAGGLIQKNKPHGLKRGKNNIGQAEIIFKSQQGSGCKTDTVTTDQVTGEYIIKLPPLKYEIPDFDISSNPDIDFKNNTLLDISNIPPYVLETDTVEIQNSTGASNQIDSIRYHKNLDFIYNITPTISMANDDFSPLTGDSIIVSGTDTFKVRDLNLPYSVFTENRTYKTKVIAGQIYENRDAVSSNGAIIYDSVPIQQGKLIIKNFLSNILDTTFNITPLDSFPGYLNYSFKDGQANPTVESDDRLSFTKNLEVRLEAPNTTTAHWKPDLLISSANPGNYKGVVLGARALGSTFITEGPQIVTMVLRDPPGSGSFSAWQKNSEVTTSMSLELNTSAGGSVENKVSAGLEFEAGLGYITPTKIEASATNTNRVEASIGANGEIIETVSNSVDIATGDNEEFVGSAADLFFGKSFNMDFGKAEVVKLVEASNCPTSGSSANFTCGTTTYPITVNGVVKDYKLAKNVAVFVIPKTYGTEFVYTQRGIEGILIPKLKLLIADLLSNTTNNYTTNLSNPPGSPNYGLANDDPRVKGDDSGKPNSFEYDDVSGNSYIFTGITTDADNVKNGVDSIWWYNQQIRLWEKALEDNEKAKVNASSRSLERNISYQAGGPITYTSSRTQDSSASVTIAVNIGKDLALSVGAEVGGTGAEITETLNIDVNTSSTLSYTTGTSTTFAYTISDLDADDEFSVDIFNDDANGYGPIFKTRGGQTSCPYQGEEKTRYYQPGTVINAATLQLDQPAIAVAQSTISNVPSDQDAVFNITLKNLGSENAIYDLRVLENTNTNGAIILMDGISPNRPIAIPGNGGTVYKQLVVRRGSSEIKYENIGISLQSQCQFSYGTSGYDDIDSTIYITANFVPSCTDLEVEEPGDLFILNNEAEKPKTVEVEITNFDVNYFGLENIRFQYRPSTSPQWITLGQHWIMKDSLDSINTTRSPIVDLKDTTAFPSNSNTLKYDFVMDQLSDGNYQLRAFSTCRIPGVAEDVIKYSDPISGTRDVLNPSPFGTPSPGDGVLDPNDDISIEFNEDIQASTVTTDNISLTGVINGQPIRHDKSIAFNGTSEFLEVPNGFNFSEGDFTIEFWLKPTVLGKPQTIISKGSSTNLFYIGFDGSNKLLVQLGSATHISTSVTIVQGDLNEWTHFSVAYDSKQARLEMYKRPLLGSSQSDNIGKVSDHISGGKTYIGKNSDNTNYFQGSMDNLRFWNKYFDNSTISGRSSLLLKGNEVGLIAYYPMNEGRGNEVKDIARSRNIPMNAQWELNPLSLNLELNGTSQHAEISMAGELSITEEMDMTVEFWFKTPSTTSAQSFISNGSGMKVTGDVNRNGWDIAMDVNHNILVSNNDSTYLMVDSNYADNKWHHFALVLNRRANATAYVDGLQHNSVSSKGFKGFGATKLALGARFNLNGTVESFDNYFTGRLDEVRVWNSARLVNSLDFNRFNGLNGNEIGLKAYYPFEEYDLANRINTISLKNVADTARNLILTNVGSFTIDNVSSPLVSLPQPVTPINFSFNLNNDKIVISPTAEPSEIENVTLNVSVKDVKDLNGNSMQSPKTWIAFVNKNQVVWQDASVSKLKQLNDTLTFTNKIVNNGGGVNQFTLVNLPEWLTASQTSGTVAPLSTKNITFTVDPNVAIGDYSEDVHLRTDHGFDEKFQVNLKVRKTAPAFTVNPSNFQHSMSFIGQISINDKIASNEEDLLIAYSGTEIRGVAQLQYEELFDRFVVYIDVYANTNGDPITFKVWNSRNGELHSDVQLIGLTPKNSIAFSTNGLVGSPSAPQVFNAIDYIEKDIPLKKGWNWVSFPLLNENQHSLKDFFIAYNSNQIIELKTTSSANSFIGQNANGTWPVKAELNSITDSLSYLIKISAADTLRYYGFAQSADTVFVTVEKGWHRIGFVPLSNMPLVRALSNYNAQQGDLIKSQSNFAYYDNTLGWVGSLTTMKPTEGYLMKAAQKSRFTYPVSRASRLNSVDNSEYITKILEEQYNFDAGDFESSTNAIVSIECDNLTANENLMLGAYNGKDIRGLAKLSEVNDGNQFYLTVHGNENETFNYVLMDNDSKEQIELEGSLQFAKNSLAGTPTHPIVIKFKTIADCEKFEVKPIVTPSILSPNPFSKSLTISLPATLVDNSVIDFIDANGRVLTSFNSNGRATIQLENEIHNLGGLSSGIYFIRIVNNDEVRIEKAIKL